MSRKWPPNGLWEDPRQIPEPWPPQQPYDPRAQYQNPGNTLPYPAPGKMPLGLWSGAPTQMVWSAGTAPFARETQWQSPVFDLRPSYRNARGKDDTANTMPIWKPSATNPGAGGKLWVQISPMYGGVSLKSMEVFYEEFGHIQDSSKIEKLAPETDITDQFVPGQEAMVLAFWPPGDGYPIRYFSVKIIIKLRDGTLASDPPFVIQGSYY